MTKLISVILGSTRWDRFSERPAQWILQELGKREAIDARLLDLPMPLLHQPLSPAIAGPAAFVSHGSSQGTRER